MTQNKSLLKNKILLIIFAGLLAGCGGDGFLGNINDDPKLEGKRIDLIKSDDVSVADKAAHDLIVKIPAQEELKSWSNSNGSQYNYPANITLGEISEKYKSKRVVTLTRRSYYLTATPVITQNHIFVLNGGGKLFAYDKGNLDKSLWVKNLATSDEREESIGGGMVYNDGILYVTNGQQDVMAISVENGKELWRHSLDNVVRSAPIIQHDKLFVSTIDNKLYFMDLRTGNILWISDGAAESIGVFGSASIAVDGNIIVFPHSSGQLHAIDIHNGEEIWSANLSYNNSSLNVLSFSDIDVTPVIRDNKVYVAGNMGSLYAINLADGVPFWKRDIKGIRSIWVSGDFLYVINAKNELLALSRDSGLIKWVSKLAGDKKPSVENKAIGPVMAGGKLFIATNFGELHIVDPLDGKIIQTKKIPQGVNLVPVIIDNKVYLLTDVGELVIF